ncbi:hypothetical protein N7519_003296 [Penicillium mononematosum]|uniref:uncharacterized protein n=1 Tax=Penicillium mononematosum TaxID=268346 RepID=UPI00254759A7|nr:uncharacterized protein N7519_003296 [Penicillium mononematosum]KAJ6188388.1 hypothetical protein N7519_003296 [Penicillium mononematosum]
MADNQAADDAGGDRLPLRPGEIGPNNARNRAQKKRRREAQAVREEAERRPLTPGGMNWKTSSPMTWCHACRRSGPNDGPADNNAPAPAPAALCRSMRTAGHEVNRQAQAEREEAEAMDARHRELKNHVAAVQSIAAFVGGFRFLAEMLAEMAKINDKIKKFEAHCQSYLDLWQRAAHVVSAGGAATPVVGVTSRGAPIVGAADRVVPNNAPAAPRCRQ